MRDNDEQICYVWDAHRLAFLAFVAGFVLGFLARA